MAGKGKMGGILLIIGAILLVVSLLVGWYVATYTSNTTIGTTSVSVKATETLNLGSSYTIAGTSSGGGFSISVSQTCPYAGNATCRATNATGALYSSMQFVVIGGVVLGFLGGILALMGGAKPGMRKIGLVLGVIALLLAIVAPMTLLAAQPGAIKSDETFHGVSPNGTGPYSSFFGSCSGSACQGAPGGSSGNTSGSWGPSTGWYLSVVGFVILLLGVLMSRGSKESMAPAPAATPAPMDSSAPPMSSPPASPPS